MGVIKLIVHDIEHLITISLYYITHLLLIIIYYYGYYFIMCVHKTICKIDLNIHHKRMYVMNIIKAYEYIYHRFSASNNAHVCHIVNPKLVEISLFDTALQRFSHQIQEIEKKSVTHQHASHHTNHQRKMAS